MEVVFLAVSDNQEEANNVPDSYEPPISATEQNPPRNPGGSTYEPMMDFSQSISACTMRRALLLPAPVQGPWVASHRNS